MMIPPPDVPVLLYDGQCAFCVRESARLQRWVGDRLRLESFRDPDVLNRYPGLSLASCEEAMQLITPDGRIWSGAAAFARALRLRSLLAPLGWCYWLPGVHWASDRLYHWIAQRRFGLSETVCVDPECRRHSAASTPSGSAPAAPSKPTAAAPLGGPIAAHASPRDPLPFPPTVAPTHGRALVRDLFLRLLGLVFLVAFASLYVQIPMLFGRRGLLPATEYLQSIRPKAGPLDAPGLFWWDSSDSALRGVAAAGMAFSLGLILNVAPGPCLFALGMLYLSFVSIGREFLSFQWDNLLLESAFFSLFIVPWGIRPRRSAPPHPAGVFLMLWLVFRLHVESGASKLLTGDPTWRDLTAMATYYETAPIPTRLAWYAHQMPRWAHQACSLFTFLVELGAPLLLWGPRRLRAVAFLLMIAMQISIEVTANYGFFNLLSMALCLFVLDDGHLAWLPGPFHRSPDAPAPPPSRPFLNRSLSAAAAGLAVLSVVPFTPFFPLSPEVHSRLSPVRRFLGEFRFVNAYHLFASMTLIRREVVIEGSSDGMAWKSFEFRYKPGDPNRPPPFVAPHQPRVDFQLWFLLLRGRAPQEEYFRRLLEMLLTTPDDVSELFSVDPFATAPPRFVRVSCWRYTFTDSATRASSGAWWERTMEWQTRALTIEDVRR